MGLVLHEVEVRNFINYDISFIEFLALNKNKK